MKGGGRVAVVVAGFTLGLVVCVAAGPSPGAGAGAAHRPATASELLQRAVDESDVVVLARVSLVAEDTFPAGASRRRPAGLEPVAWLKGGLDAETLDVFTDEAEEADLAGWQALVGVDTLGAVVLLRRDGADWILRGDPLAGLAGGFRAVTQSHFLAVRDSVSAIVEGLVLDSLLARADLVFVGGPADTAAARAGVVTVERMLAGRAPRGPLTVRTATGAPPIGHGIMALCDTGHGVYEPVPFLRPVWTGRPGRGIEPAAEQARAEADIAAAVARLAARVEDR